MQHTRGIKITFTIDEDDLRKILLTGRHDEDIDNRAYIAKLLSGDEQEWQEFADEDVHRFFDWAVIEKTRMGVVEGPWS